MSAQPIRPDDIPLLDKLRRFLDARSDLDAEVRMIDGEYAVVAYRPGDGELRPGHSGTDGGEKEREREAEHG